MLLINSECESMRINLMKTRAIAYIFKVSVLLGKSRSAHVLFKFGARQ